MSKLPENLSSSAVPTTTSGKVVERVGNFSLRVIGSLLPKKAFFSPNHIKNFSTKADSLETAAKQRAVLAGNGLVKFLNTIDPKTSIPSGLNHLDRKLGTVGDAFIYTLNVFGKVPQPSVEFQKFVNWYSRKYIQTGSFTPIMHFIGLSVCLGIGIKMHLTQRDFEYYKMVKKMEGFNDEEAALFAYHKISSHH
eukprot:c12188_g1_i2.p1 GENE.c12188_g1_i2~~c12188_g1_i2.p1  ORF type:complete len:194 (+),score=62.90 c12188_g1_i2:39-620(+)